MLIALDGIDGCGKSTVAEGIKDKLAGDFNRIEIVHYPAYDTPLGGVIKYLKDHPPSDQFFFSVLFEANRLEKMDILRLGSDPSTLVIADRYWHSGRAYALSRGISDGEYQTLLMLNANLPEPALSFILDIDPKLASKRMKWKTLDALERNIVFQTKVRQRFLELADAFGWTVVDASADKDLVVSKIVSAIRDRHELE